MILPIRLKLLILLFLSIVLVIKYHPRFYFTEVQFSNLNFLSSQALTEVVSPYYGQNIVWVRFLSRMPSRLKAQFLHIEDLSLDIESSHSLHIAITEKKPWIGLPISGKTLFVSADGTVLNLNGEQGDLGDVLSMVFVHGVPPELIEEGRVYLPFIHSLRPVVEGVRAQFPIHALQVRFTGIQFNQHILSFQEVDVIRDDVMRIRLGSLDQFSTKFKYLKRYISAISQEEFNAISTIDLRMIPKILVSDYE
jgi:hypothetical protein